MDSKVIPLPARSKTPALSRLMIVSLIEACVKQNRGIQFGPVDIKGGSFGALIARGFVNYEEVMVRHQRQSQWQVTQQGFEILKQLGVNLDNYSLEKEIQKGVLTYLKD
ncbi:MAG: hypothetical protein M3015_17195 [Bacteroidota bacterium]|nr:hypothetical protein [Bacteroidota bacterium]